MQKTSIPSKKISLFEEDRFAFIPSECRFKSLYQLYKRHQAQFWTIAVIRISDDLSDWKKVLNEDERFFIKHILGFFAGSDKIVMDNLKESFMPEVKALEAEMFYSFQMAMEAIHTETYGLLIDGLVADHAERKHLEHAIHTIPGVKAKAQWAQKWTYAKGAPFSERLIAYIIVEGLFFSGAFCSIFWLKERGLMRNGLCKSNDLISKDEGLHVEFGFISYYIIRQLHPELVLKQSRVHEIFKEATEIEIAFICDSLPCKLVGMNSELMTQYIKYVVDFLLTQLEYDPIYKVENPFSFMILQGMDLKENFFEVQGTNYQQANTMATKKGDSQFGLDDDF